MTAPELKPCPFCGGKAQLGSFDSVTNGYWHYVSCDNKTCGISTSQFSEVRHSIAQWNRRVEPDLAAAQARAVPEGWQPNDALHARIQNIKRRFTSASLDKLLDECEQALRRQSAPKDPTPEMLAAAAVAVVPIPNNADMRLATEAAKIVVAHRDAKHGVAVAEIAAAIATMPAAYRAMLAAAHTETGGKE